MSLKEFMTEAVSPDNSRVHSGIILALPGIIIGSALLIFYGFWLQRGPGMDLVTLALGLGGGGGTVGTLAGRVFRFPPAGR